MRRLSAILLVFVLVLSMGTAAFAESSDAPYAGKTVILHSNDVHGAIEKYACVAALKADYEAKGAEVILADAGDFVQGTTYVNDARGADAVALMNAVGYDVVTIGNHEFDFGCEQLLANVAQADFKVVCANVFDADGALLFEPNYTYTTQSGLKIGFFGLETPEAKTKANPVMTKGLTFADTTIWTEAQKQIDALADADIVICLSHLGTEAGSRPYTSYDLLANTAGIDFVIDGHSHTVMTAGDGGEPIQSTGTALANVGVIVIDNGKIESNTLAALTEDMPAEETVAAVAQRIVDRVNAEYGEKFAVSEVALNGAKAPNGNRDTETNSGDLIADAMRWKVLQNSSGLTVGEDHVVAVTNGGGIRAAVQPGDLTRKDINTVLPFGNTVAVVYVTGAELLEALEASTFCTPDAVGGFPQVSGLNITLRTAKDYDANETSYPGSTYYGPASIQRVVINSVNGRAFSENDTYAVVTNNFCAAGGDTYYAFASATAQFDTGVRLDEAVMEYIATALNGVIGEAYAAPMGRITYFNPFRDVKTTAWYFGDLIRLYEDGVIAGIGAAAFAPDADLTWAAALKLLLVSSGDLSAAEAVGSGWMTNTMAKAVGLGLVDADTDGTAPISRLAFCQLAAQLNHMPASGTESGFADCADGYVTALVDAGAINGVTGNTFEPYAALTRAQAAKIICRLNAVKSAA